MAHTKLMQNGSHQLHILSVLAQEDGTWKNPVLRNVLSQELLDWDKGKMIIRGGKLITALSAKKSFKDTALLIFLYHKYFEDTVSL